MLSVFKNTVMFVCVCVCVQYESHYGRKQRTFLIRSIDLFKGNV